MEIRLTGACTSFGDISSMENVKGMEKMCLFREVPDQKIKVFISSICGVEKYDVIRAELKNVIEATGLADVYLFEEKDAATLPAGSHYSLALEDSDICIFLIDNADGIKSGVQAEIDIVKKQKIKALYYFCDENSKEKTTLEQSLMGANFAKSKTVHNFYELSREGAKALINDIISVYHYYCKGKIVLCQSEGVSETQHIDIVGMETLQVPTVPKIVLKNIDKCKEHILKFVLGKSYFRFSDTSVESSEIDEWCNQFFSVLFEGESIKHFNTGMFLEVLKKQQNDKYYQVVQIRWQAIQAYFLGDVEKCIEYLEDALKVAKETHQQAWIIKDILIDLRNQYILFSTVNNSYLESEAQKELTESNEDVYYPILDRINETLHEKYIEGLYKKKTQSPYSITFGNSFEQYGDLLASAYVVSIYNGSLTHIILFYKKIKDFLFYLCCKYDDWNFRRDILKLAIYEGKGKEIKGIQNSYPEVLNYMDAANAEAIMKYCDNHPVKHERLISQLQAFGAIGYYLSNEDYKKYEDILLREIKEWLYDSEAVNFIGQSIFQCLSGIAHRISQDILTEICCLFISRNYNYWFTDLFRFIGNNIDLCKLNAENSDMLIKHIIGIFDDDKKREQIRYAPHFLGKLRRQNRGITDELDKKVEEYLPKYYNSDYKLEIMKDDVKELTRIIQNYVYFIQRSNQTQGKNGIYFGHGTRNAAVIRSILLENDIDDKEIIDSIILSVADTLLISKEGIRAKLDAVSLLICIVIKYRDGYERNSLIFEKLIDNKETIKADMDNISSNINSIALDICLQFLYTAMGNDTYFDILELLPYIQNDIPTTIAVTRIIVEYLEASDDVVLPKKIEVVVLQNALQWKCSDYLDVRWNAITILLKMARNPENCGIVNHQLISLIDSENVYIKNLILCNIYRESGISEATRNYIVSKCENDANFVTRKVCKEIKDEYIRTDG